jgi:uncharacterized protein with ParB-like and HNH nuclease domain
VVKRRDDDKWELVDGQQRLTTLLLILRYIHEHLPTVHPKYSLEYETRPGSADYLDHPVPEQSQDNIDFFHIFGAFSRIREWFESRDNVTLAAINFYKYLSESVYIIWYEAPANVESTTLFTRLNVGRIPLTDAELVKALLLTRASELKRKREIAAQWDTIERDLRVPELWAFVTGRPRQELVALSQGLTKRKFEARLDAWIRADLSLKASDLAELRYGKMRQGASGIYGGYVRAYTGPLPPRRWAHLAVRR